MAEIELERKIVGQLIQDPELIKRYEVNQEWFEDGMLAKIIEAMTISQRDYLDLSEIVHDVKSLYPSLSITEESLRALRVYKLEIDNFGASVKTLERNYIIRKTMEASNTYANQPTKKNSESLHHWLMIKEESEINEDEGELPIMDLVNDLDNDQEDGIKTFSKFDDFLGKGLEGGMLVVLAARPGVGKTAYAVSSTIKAMERNEDLIVDVFTLEMTKKQMLKRYSSNITRINGYKFKKPKEAMTQEEKMDVIRSADIISKSGLRIHDSRMNIREIDRMIRKRVFDNPDRPYMAVVDYLQLIDSGNSRAPRTEQVGIITRTLKLLTNELNIPIILLSQLNRAVESRDDKRPKLSDLRDSGEIEQDANVVAFLYQADEFDGNDPVIQVNLDISKNREGMLGEIDYYFFRAESRFQEI